jgi:hypothetical protein
MPMTHSVQNIPNYLPSVSTLRITNEMNVTFEGEGGEGGPRREFKTNKDATRPSYDVS